MIITVVHDKLLVDASENLKNKIDQISLVVKSVKTEVKEVEIQCKLATFCDTPLWKRSDNDRKDTDQIITATQHSLKKGFGSNFSIFDP